MKTADSSLLEKLNLTIEANIQNTDYGVDEICLDLAMSRSQLYRLIKGETGLSPSLYIRQRKLLKARYLLTASNLKASEIAYKIGIDSPQNFSKYFAQEFGLSPIAFRKQVSQAATSPSPETPHSIEVQEPVEMPPAIVSTPTSTQLDDSIKTRAVQHRNWWPYLSVAATLVILILVGYFWTSPEKTDGELYAPVFDGSSVAIVPFENLGQPHTDFYSDGVRQQIHSSLSMIQKLKVISTTSSNRYRNTTLSASAIARELGVTYILEGSVLQDGSKVRINVELVRGKDDRTIWARSFDGSAGDLLSYLNIVSTEVAEELGQQLSDGTLERLGRVLTTSPAAYREYLHGNQLIATRTREGLEESILKLNNAIEFDPEFADAYTARGMAYFLLGESAFIDERTSFMLAEENALAAIRIDGENGLAYASLANIYRAQNKWEPAKAAYEIALKYNPNDAQINYWYSLMLRTTGRITEAIRYSSRAVALDPLHHVIFSGHLQNCIYGKEYEIAEKGFADGRVLFSDSWVFNWSLGKYYLQKGDLERAIESLEKANALNPKIRVIKTEIAFCQARRGNKAFAMEYLHAMPDLPSYYPSKAVVYAGMGDKEKSLEFMKLGAENGIISTDIKVTPYFSILKDEPEYNAILQKFGL